MNITMTINAETPAELFSTVKGCAAQIAGECPTATPDKPAAPANSTIAPANPTIAPANPTTAPVSPVVAPPASTTPAAPSASASTAAASTSAGTAPAPMTAPTNAAMTAPTAAPAAGPAPVPLAETPAYTIEDISKAGAGLAQAGRVNELVALLAQFGVRACMELKPEQYGAFATALRGLGANI